MNKELPSVYQTDYESGNHYVYLHKDGAEVVYVGVGTSCRAFRSCGFGHRIKEHGAWLDSKYNEGNIPVEFYVTNISKSAAFQIEKELILHYRPKYNKQHNPDVSLTRFSTESIILAKALHKMGYSYAKIAYLLGDITAKSKKSTKCMTIWRMINE